MKHPRIIDSFFKDQSGAVTVDWVVLAAAVVGVAIAALSTVSTGVQDLSEDISVQLAISQIRTTF